MRAGLFVGILNGCFGRPGFTRQRNIELKEIMLKKILIATAAVIALFFVIVASRPADFRVERSATLAAPPAALFEQVNNHRKFTVWNPFMKLDPNVKTTYSGPDAGVGAVCSWDGNNDIGAGSCTIIESKPNERVRSRMDWKRPMEGTARWILRSSPAATRPS